MFSSPVFISVTQRDVLSACIMGRSVGGHGVADPASEVADLGVDAGLVPLGAAVTPGDHTLQLPAAHHRSARVALSGHR